MRQGAKRKIAVGVVVATAAGGGAAWAAATSSNGDLRTAYLNEVAKRLDVSPDKLNGALKGAYLDQLDRAVEDGRLTQAQADALKKRVDDVGVPLGLGGTMHGHGRGSHERFGHRFGFGHRVGPFGSMISAAARFLGISESELQTQLRSGTTLADVAKQKGKSANDLIAALVAAEEKQLGEAVDDKRITDDQRDAIAKDLPARIKALVEGGRPAGGLRLRPRADRPRSGGFVPAAPPGGEL